MVRRARGPRPAPAPGPRKVVAAAAAGGLGPPEVEELHCGLLGWYDRAHRVLPWRRNPASRVDPAAAAAAGGGAPAEADLPAAAFAYRVWVSEVMLQQTRVATVVDYFRAWVEAFPTVEALAAAEEEEVLKRWAGLGYYRRARFLLKGARYVVDELGGVLPSDVAGLLKIPGSARTPPTPWPPSRSVRGWVSWTATWCAS